MVFAAFASSLEKVVFLLFRLLFLYEGKIVWQGMTHEFTTSTNPIVQQVPSFHMFTSNFNIEVLGCSLSNSFYFCFSQFATGSLDGPIRY